MRFFESAAAGCIDDAPKLLRIRLWSTFYAGHIFANRSRFVGRASAVAHRTGGSMQNVCPDALGDDGIAQRVLDLCCLENDVLSRCPSCRGACSSQCDILEHELMRKHGIAPVSAKAEASLRLLASTGLLPIPCASCAKLCRVYAEIAAALSRLLCRA